MLLWAYDYCGHIYYVSLTLEKRQQSKYRKIFSEGMKVMGVLKTFIAYWLRDAPPTV